MSKDIDIIVQDPGSQMLTLIEKVVANPDVDVNKLEKLLDIQIRMMDKQAEILYNQAMAKMQGELPIIHHTGELRHKGKLISTYSKYEDIAIVINPIMAENGFSISYDTEEIEKETYIIGILAHSAGHQKTRRIKLPIDTSGAKNPIQAMGSTITYGQRYLQKLLLNIVTTGEDTDGKTDIKEKDLTEKELIESKQLEINTLVGQLSKESRKPFLSEVKGVKKITIDYLITLEERIKVAIEEVRNA